MAMLPESARTAAAYLGGGIARNIERQGQRIAGMGGSVTGIIGGIGQQVQNVGQTVGMLGAKEGVVRTSSSRAAKTLSQNPLAAKVGGFLESMGAGVNNLGAGAGETVGGIGQTMQQFGASAGKPGAIKKRDIGLAAVGAAMTGAFVGGMGANSGINALIGFQATNPRGRVPAEPGRMGGNTMPADLQTSYIALNQPGSPLGMQQMRLSYDMKTAQERQRLLRAAMGPEAVYNNGPEAES